MCYNAARSIQNGFFDVGTNFDGVDRDGECYIDCNKINDMQKGVCKGVVVGSTNDAAALAIVKCRLRGNNEKVNIYMDLGIAHEYEINRIYGNVGNANNVVILF